MVSNKLPPKRLHVANYPIGLEYRASQVLSLFNFNSDCVNMIGICGIGKTTLARSVYNFIFDRFEGSCFLADVRESSIKHGLEHLQEFILLDILGEKNVKLGDSHKGIPILIKKLHNKKVVLILDDVDKLEQLRKLAGDRDWFDSGSAIIITARDRHILTAHGVENEIVEHLVIATAKRIMTTLAAILWVNGRDLYEGRNKRHVLLGKRQRCITFLIYSSQFLLLNS
ncbi:hypothetical protein K1719_002836 [Acacia pycnantha]|nr:hypothetical protein K1719_002836 [Acacia pycnantha]